MRHILLAAILVPSLLSAQIPKEIPRPRVVQPQVPGQIPSPGNVLPDNYEITLTITDKEEPPVDLSVVVASTLFNASLGVQGLTFAGTVIPEGSGEILVTYTLGWETAIPAGNNTQYKSSSTQGSVRMKLGDDIQIIRAGTRVARLSIKKLEMAKPQ